MCLKCRGVSQYSGQEILRYQARGCRQCRTEDADKKREEIYKSYIDSIFGNLKVIGYSGKKADCKSSAYYRPCEKCAKENLKKGYEIHKIASVDGTLITAIDGHRKINKNSSTHHTGVSWMPKLQKYRAYINFQRKQYSLGLFSRIEDAVAARKEAERQIYGDFLRWYEEAYPENWERLKQRGSDAPSKQGEVHGRI